MNDMDKNELKEIAGIVIHTFKTWFHTHNDILRQECFSYEHGNQMVITSL